MQFNKIYILQAVLVAGMWLNASNVLACDHDKDCQKQCEKKKGAKCDHGKSCDECQICSQDKTCSVAKKKDDEQCHLNNKGAVATKGKSEKCHEEESKKQCDMKAPVASSAFSDLKAIAGNWSGSHMMNGKEEAIKINYRLTAGGTALVETLGPGTPKEMISVYTSEGKDKVRMVHYCMMGNQPNLVLDSYKDNVFHFDFVKSPTASSSCKEGYMGELTITIKDKNHMNQKWVAKKKGKIMDTVQFDLTRRY